MFCARLFICASWSPAGKGLTSWLSFVVSSVSLSLSHWYPGSGVGQVWYLIVSIPVLTVTVNELIESRFITWRSFIISKLAIYNVLLSCQPRMTVTSCFVNNVIRDL